MSGEGEETDKLEELCKHCFHEVQSYSHWWFSKWRPEEGRLYETTTTLKRCCQCGYSYWENVASEGPYTRDHPATYLVGMRER